jgi:aspartokinase
MTIETDAKRLAIEAISTLVNIKKAAADLVLRKAAVPEPLIKRFLSERDPATGSKRSKRDAAAMILEELAKTGQEDEVVRNLIAVASEFSAYHLSQDEFVARGVQQKAATYRGILEENEAKSRAAAAADLEAAQQSRKKEQREIVERQSELLLAQFDELARSENPQHRGYMLEDLLNRAFVLY